MAMIVADTDVLIDYLNGRQPVAERIALELQSGLGTTVITRFELLSGAKSRPAHKAVTALLAALGTLVVDAESANQAAEIRRELERAGAPISMADSLIAGVVLRNKAILLTRNRRHFERVKGLSLGTLAV